MAKFRRNYNEDTTWQAVYMDLITLVMVLFLILWSLQSGGDGAPVETNKLIPFSKLSLGDSSFPNGGTVFGGEQKTMLANHLEKSKRDLFTKLGYSEVDDKFYYITVHGHSSLTGGYESNMNIALQRAMSVADSIKDSYNKIGAKEFSNQTPTRNKQYMISVCGHAYNFPKVPLDTSLSGKASSDQQMRNRRVDVMYHEVPKKMMDKYYLAD